MKAVAALVAILLAATHGRTLSDTSRAEWKRALERARYKFVLGEKPPFDQAYPLSFFQKQVQQEHERELALKRIYSVSVNHDVLTYEYDRIEKSTKAPEQWEAIKNALKNDRWLIEQIVCRPTLVDRALRAKFEFDQKIHAAAHQEARRARAEFLAGSRPAGGVVASLSRKADAQQSTEEMLRQARAESSLPRVLEPQVQAKVTPPFAMEPEASALLEKQFHKPGDVSTIFEYRDRFEVYRLVEATPSIWKVEMVRVPKKDFDSWYDAERRQVRKSR